MGRLRKVEWPNKAKLAVTFTVALELWSEGETPVPVMVSKVEDAKFRGAKIPPKTIDLHAIDTVEYGGRRGIWRLIDLFERSKVPSTVTVSGRAAEMFPEAVAECTQKWARNRWPLLLSRRLPISLLSTVRDKVRTR